MEQTKESNFFLDKPVEQGCNQSIRTIFMTLLLEKKAKQQDLADFCGIDKAYVSRVVNGIYEPQLAMKLKIASFFGVDTRIIWRDIDG